MNRTYLRMTALALMLSLSTLAAGCRDNPVADEVRRFTGLGLAEPGIVATINGTPLYLKQVEALADMRSPSLNEARAITVEELWADYADSLYELIIQELIRRELEKLGLKVEDEEVRELERLVSSGYSLEPGAEFDEYLEEAGLNPEYWRGQLKARLEQELWEKQLPKAGIVSPEDVETYLAGHPELAVSPASFEFLSVEGTDRALVEKMRRRGETSQTKLKEAGLSVKHSLRPLASVPELWRTDLASLKPGQVSARIRQNGKEWGYIILLEKKPERRRSPMELFSLAEGDLLAAALPELYATWLDSALLNADIKVAKQFLPGNVPMPPLHRDTVFPWEHSPEPEDDDALGEVEGEVSADE